MNPDIEIRVGIVIENYFPRLGGMEFATYQLAQALSKLPRTRVAVACSTMRGVPDDFPYPHPVYRARSLSVFTPYLYRRNVERMIRREKVNILHGQMLHGGGATAVDIGRKFRLPVVAASRGADVQRVPEIGYGARMSAEEEQKIRQVIRQADRVLALSQVNREAVIALGGDSDRVALAPNGCLFDELGAVPAEGLRPRYGVGPDDFLLITVGRNRPIKRMELLYQALARIQNSSRPVKCLSVGPEENLRELVRTYGLEDRVILTGPVPSTPEERLSGPPFPRLVNLLRAADLFVSVSHMEAFNSSALEALACGTPALISRNQGIRDAIEEGRNGFILHDETPEALAGLLTAVIDRRIGTSLNRTAVRESVAHLSWENAARRLREIYESLL